MTITLDDVASLLHVPVTSKAVTCLKLSFANAQSLLEQALGIETDVAYRELGTKRGQSVKLEWLHTKFSTISDTTPDVEVQHATRGCCLRNLIALLFHILMNVSQTTWSGMPASPTSEYSHFNIDGLHLDIRIHLLRARRSSA
ncbi:hypothetical protein L1049_019711 [Liquidambar formosana]|uniref:Uncharacterized protein n=1 Tax=Liquidambar formosana TaxID=63359 RepID=A0AAP0X5G7_LIQFO